MLGSLTKDILSEFLPSVYKSLVQFPSSHKTRHGIIPALRSQSQEDQKLHIQLFRASLDYMRHCLRERGDRRETDRERVSHTPGLYPQPKFTVQSKLVLNSLSSCCHLLSAGVIRMCHHVWLYVCVLIKFQANFFLISGEIFIFPCPHSDQRPQIIVPITPPKCSSLGQSQ